MTGNAGADSTESKWAILGAYRFVLAALVVYVHLVWVASPIKPIYVPLSAVLCFLVISGYSIAASLEREPAGFYYRRFVRIYPIYLVGLILTLVLAALGAAKDVAFVTDQTDPLSVIGSFLMLQGILTPIWSLIGPSWSLSLEVFYYVLAPWLQKLRLRHLGAFWAVSAVFYMWHAHETGQNYNQSENGLSLIGLGWAWLAGFIFCRFERIPFARTLLLIGTPFVYATFIWQDGRLGLGLLFVTGMLLAASPERFHLPLKWRTALNRLGDLSYPLYICHFQTFTLVGTILTRPGREIVKPGPFLLVSASLAISILALVLVDLPARRWLLRRKPHAVV